MTDEHTDLYQQFDACLRALLDPAFPSSLDAGPAPAPPTCPHCGRDRTRHTRSDAPGLRWRCTPCERRRKREAA